jgi:hypothetical protein
MKEGETLNAVRLDGKALCGDKRFIRHCAGWYSWPDASPDGAASGPGEGVGELIVVAKRGKSPRTFSSTTVTAFTSRLSLLQSSRSSHDFRLLTSSETSLHILLISNLSSNGIQPALHPLAPSPRNLPLDLQPNRKERTPSFQQTWGGFLGLGSGQTSGLLSPGSGLAILGLLGVGVGFALVSGFDVGGVGGDEVVGESTRL